ncbi:tRNA 4-thiouridine(8) synthase ThiI [Candidatus Aerophobetes bacterium]|nr:tRNA 4-thiouridine(8) synthase ThiI [Candidatus Aerophobetes bacterium]
MRALSLFSGGLDSTLAVKLIQKQGIEVEGVCFTSPFFTPEKAKKAAQNLKIYLHTIDISKDLLSLLRSPPHGFGKGANPCIDCHALMVKKAGSLMQKIGASFLISGEVLGERPKSQNRWALNIVEKESGWGDYLLRPLTAKNLAPTLPEREGWVKREKLLEIKGRSRQAQLKMAKLLGIREFPTPAGGCLLTDPILSRRIKDLLVRGKLNLNEIELLKVGRHFRLGDRVKLIVGRNEEENRKILQLALAGDTCLQASDYAGPVGLLREKEDEMLLIAASIIIRYSDAPLSGGKVEHFKLPQRKKEYLEAIPIEDEKLETLRIQ